MNSHITCNYLFLDLPVLGWFGLILYVSVNNYGHVQMVSSPNQTFFLGKLDKVVNQYFVQILSLVTDNNPS